MIRTLTAMTPYQRRVYDLVAELQPNAYGVTLHRRYEAVYGPTAFITIHKAAWALAETGWLDTQKEPGGPERGFRDKRLYFIARRVA